MGEGERIYGVVALTRSIRKNLLANNEKLAGVWIEGEISGNRRYASGHRYFTLKGSEKGVEAQISCVLFGFNEGRCQREFREVLARGDEAVNGLKVQVQGELDLNMGRGGYSFKASTIRIAGLGEKMAAFNALKAKIAAAGLDKLDNPGLRRPLPFLPRRIGIVTSGSGAVIHDMCDVLTRRFPGVGIRLYPVKVQGDGAAEEIVAGVRFFNGELVNHDPLWVPDVIIVGRGGGSVEDLWAFNEEPVVMAVASSRIPIVSAVGHESDVTLCDYVADLRAGTPSIAAERVVCVKADLAKKLDDLGDRLVRALRGRIEGDAQTLDYLSLRLARAPSGALERFRSRLDRVSAMLAPSAREAATRCSLRLERAALALAVAAKEPVRRAEARLAGLNGKLTALDPQQVLNRGFSVTLDASGRALRRAGDVRSGDRLVTRLAEGTIESTVA